MADDKTKRGGADRKLIALTEKYEVAYWSKKFKVTPAKLKYAVKKVGHSARKVEEYIKLQKHRAADKKLIALGEAYEVRYWSKKFKITPAKLKAAVAAAGHSSKKVEAYLTARKAAKKKAAKKTVKKTAKKTTKRKKAG
jgi:BRCT domain type II-containing protein